MSPYRVEAALAVDAPAAPRWLAWLADFAWAADRPWYRRLLGGRWELWWSGARLDPTMPPSGYLRWHRVDSWNELWVLRPWRRIDRFAVEQLGWWYGLGDTTIAREDRR